MILLSALLASLTGLVAGERPAERAQVELSAFAAVVESGQALKQGGERPRAGQPLLRRMVVAIFPVLASIPALSPRTILSLKQSWLI